MKVLVILPPGSEFSNKQSSIETVVANLSRAVTSQRRVQIICDSLPNGSKTPAELDVVRLSPYRNKWARTADVISHVRHLRPDIIELHQHTPTASLVARFCSDVPSLLYKHNFVKSSKNLIGKKIQEAQYRQFNKILFVSDAANTKFQFDFPSQAHKSRTVMNAIDIEGWVGDVAKKERLITFVGNAAPEKGFAELCGALTTILVKYTDWTATIIAGHWDMHNEWATNACRPLQGFGQRFCLLKNQPKDIVQSWQKKAAISIVPSLYEEAFGLSALEAHLAGAAVVSSGRGGLREVSNKFAVYVDQVTVSSLTDAVDRLISNPELRDSFARKGQDHVLRTHRLEDRAKDLFAIENEIVEEFARRGQTSTLP